MEIEKFFSGYCRQIDGSRMVAVVLEDGKLTEVDCAYSNCPYAPSCLIGKEIETAIPCR